MVAASSSVEGDGCDRGKVDKRSYYVSLKKWKLHLDEFRRRFVRFAVRSLRRHAKNTRKQEEYERYIFIERGR